MAYVPDPTDITRPLSTDIAASAAEEFRSLKAYIASLAGLGGGMNLFRKNAIIGGDFSLNPWQRGTSFAAIADGSYSADRWSYRKNGAMVHTVSKSTDAPTVSASNVLTSHCLLMDCTTIDAAIAAGDFCRMQYKVEGYDFAAMLGQRTMTLSFWHKHTKVGTYCVGFLNTGVDRSYVAEYTQDVADTWEYASITVPASPSAGTWDYTDGIGLRVHFVAACGTTYQTTANSWQAGYFTATANQVNACDDVANNFRLALVQLESSPVATSFEPMQEVDVLNRCLRYYEKSFAIATAPAQNAGRANAVEWMQGVGAGVACVSQFFPFKVRKRTVPGTITTYNPLAANSQVRNASAGADCAGTSYNVVMESGFTIACTTPGGSVVQDALSVCWTVDTEL